MANKFKGLPENALEVAKKWAIVFDFDDDCCYPAPALSTAGEVNGGLPTSGKQTGSCRDMDQFQQANTYCRYRYVKKDSDIFLVIMYALYFQKDQVAPWNPIPSDPGHRHDWEYGLVWVKNGALTHASYSEHGDAHTKPISALDFDSGMEDHVKLVYHKDMEMTRCMRFAKEEEKAENGLGKWLTPNLVEWELLDDEQRSTLTNHDFGSAHFPVKDENFFTEITDAGCIPEGYPSEADWKNNSHYKLGD